LIVNSSVSAADRMAGTSAAACGVEPLRECGQRISVASFIACATDNVAKTNWSKSDARSARQAGDGIDAQGKATLTNDTDAASPK
jgi:hypothetical protein